MNKSVMISIHPKWCERIANGEKTIEIRKTKPRLKTPFKCYIYCTKAKVITLDVIKDGDSIFGETYHGKTQFIKSIEGSVCDMYGKQQKVIGEYVCDSLIQINYNKSGYGLDDSVINGVIAKSCLGEKELYKYLKGEKPYLYHISDLVIYDEPKELRNFMSAATGKPLTRPPQSWCYVEEIRTNE